MMQFYLFRLPAIFASLTLLALLGACGKQDAGTASQAADMPGSPPRVSTSRAEQDLPEECRQAIAAQRACTETLAAKYERIGHPEAAKGLRDELPDLEKVAALWLTSPSMEYLRRDCIATRDGIQAAPQCQP